MFIETIYPRLSETNVAGHIGCVVLPVWFDKASEKVYQIIVPDLNFDTGGPVVVGFSMECLREINHIQEVIIKTEIQQIGNSSISLIQHLEQDKEISAIARTTLVYFDYKHKKTLPIHETLRTALEEHLEGH